MNIRKRIVSAIALAAMASTSLLFAQEGKGKGGRGMTTEAAVTRIDEAVTLTAAQKPKVQAILAKVQDQIAALPQEERRAKGTELRQAANKEIRALLTPDQQKKFDAMPAPQSGGGGKKNK